LRQTFIQTFRPSPRPNNPQKNTQKSRGEYSPRLPGPNSAVLPAKKQRSIGHKWAASVSLYAAERQSSVFPEENQKFPSSVRIAWFGESLRPLITIECKVPITHLSSRRHLPLILAEYERACQALFSQFLLVLSLSCWTKLLLCEIIKRSALPVGQRFVRADSTAFQGGTNEI